MSSDLNELLKFARSKANLLPHEERELARRIKLGDKAAKDKLVEHNMRLAFKLASEWAGSGLDRDDLVQTALTGLTHAAGKFDPDKGRFTTYATRWIYKELWDTAYANQNVIKRPSTVSRTATAIREYVKSNPTAGLEEIADAIDKPLNEVREAMDHAQVVTSTSDENFVEVGSEEIEEASELLDLLTLEEREAISWQHGVYGWPCSLEQVAEKLTRDQRLPGAYTAKDVGRLTRQATKKLRAARRTDEDVLCQVDHD